ncbi:mitochondrial carrier [Flagelloscypha sp. PMI_526]|nr:mitochondrial carrier [Flagelloscypha sp. PMI_526]
MSASSGSRSSYPFWLGGVAASMAACCTHPLDLTKVRMQTLQIPSNGKNPSTFFVIRKSIANSGFRSLYTGLSASIMRQLTYSLVRIGIYEDLKAQITSRGYPKLYYLYAATVAGCLGGLAGNPADIILVRMTSDRIRPPEARYNYSNGLQGLANLVRNEGLPGLSRGIVPNTVRALLMNVSQIGSYDFFKTSLLRKTVPLTDYQLQDNLVLHVVSSGLAGIVATTVCSPADVIRSRIMSSSSKQSTFEVLKTSLQHEGPRFLFKGWTPAFIRLGPNTVFLFVFFEQLKKVWDTTIL